MAVHLYALAWNEADMLPFFFRHYDPWVDRYVIYDNGSTDGTRDRLAAHPRVEVRRFEPRVDGSFVASHQHLQDTCWQESRGAAEWVVVTAIDEHLHVPHTPMQAFLAARRREGATLVPALGYQMIADDFPAPDERLCETRRFGAPFWQMNKLSLFDPASVLETRFGPGRHDARPLGRLVLPARDELLLLHYKYLGFDRVRARNAALGRGLGAVDRARRRGVQYGWSADRLRREWERTRAAAVDIGDADLAPWDSHRVPRWWRSPRRYRAARWVRKVQDRLSREA